MDAREKGHCPHFFKIVAVVKRDRDLVMFFSREEGGVIPPLTA
jgi:hypothetical protein